MNLYANLRLEREPFSNSPDPVFMHETRQHATCLQELEIALRLRRGLNVITGDIGTGKTTLCRSLLRAFAEDGAADLHLLLDPHFDSPEDFLRMILGSVSRLAPDPALNLWELKEALKQQLFRLGVVENRLVALVIDEGQKISRESLELLREMLNYETNSCKLLQIVIFAQRELEPVLAAMPNLADRINVRRRLGPLSLDETRRMIRYRLQVAAGAGAKPRVRFTSAAALAIHLSGRGLPRQTVRLCHMAMLEMLVRGKAQVGLQEARAAIRPEQDASGLRSRCGLALAAAAGLCLVLGALWLSVNPSGPVLGPRAQTALPAAAPAPEQSRKQAQTQPAAAAAEAAPARPEGRAAGLAPAGLTLLPEREEDPAAPAGLTLQPPCDQGPTMRRPIAPPVPAQLRVAAPGDPGLARAVTVSMIGQ